MFLALYCHTQYIYIYIIRADRRERQAHTKVISSISPALVDADVRISRSVFIREALTHICAAVAQLFRNEGFANIRLITGVLAGAESAGPQLL